MKKRVAAAVAVLASVVACSAEGSSGRDLTCPDDMSSAFPDHDESDPGARTAALAAEPYLDLADRVVEDGGEGTVTYRGYDSDRDLESIVRVVQWGGDWYPDRIDTCEP